MDTAAFVDLLMASDVLRFGDFTTKSGRRTPYFLNFGALGTGHQLDLVGRAYADHLVAHHHGRFDVLFGPAYKGIPLVVATAVALQRDHGIDVAWCCNRKEVKDHGEGGVLIGHVPTAGQRVVIVEDVTTAGTSIRETVPLLQAAADGVVVTGLVIAVDRLERHTRDAMTALAQVAEEFDLDATAIATIDEVVDVLADPGRGDTSLSAEQHARLVEYRHRWGVR